MQPISYQLIIDIRETIEVEVGRLGAFVFPAGRYVYTGSARRGLQQRLERHRRRNKKAQWHIDYLLQRQEAQIVDVRTFAEEECLINSRQEGCVIVPGFGASDCRSGCKSHLKLLETF